MLPIKTYKDVLSPEQCEHIIETLHNSYLFDIVEDSAVFKGCVIYSPGITDELTLSLTDIVWEYARQYSVDNNIGLINPDSMQTMIFEEDKGFYGYHYDSLDRKFSAILFLNDVEEGGGLKIHLPDGIIYGVKATAGKMVMFDANLFYETLMPTSSDMNTIITWYK